MIERYCCYIDPETGDCPQPAEFVIHGPGGFEDDTEACAEHVHLLRYHGDSVSPIPKETACTQ